jgi:HAD superfamily phosphatase (TIGR01668 family)
MWTAGEQLGLPVQAVTRPIPTRPAPVSKSEDSGENSGNPATVLRPDAYAERLSSVSLDDLESRGVRGLIVDLDNTLVGYQQEACSAEDAAWVARAIGRGFRVVLVSNNFTERVRKIGAALGVPAVPNALKPLPTGFLRALALLGTPRRATIVVGDQLFTDVLGAKLCGLRAILTHPLDAHDWHGTRVLRFFERLVLGRRRPRA